MAGTWSLSDGSNVMNLEVWAQSASGEWRKIVSAGFEANGAQRVVLDDKTGFVSLLVKKSGSESETEVFRYDLGAAVR